MLPPMSSADTPAAKAQMFFSTHPMGKSTAALTSVLPVS